jgi:mRNA interferase RelE/StbE
LASKPESWSVEWAETAIRDLGKLDKAVARRIIAKIELAAQDPTRFFERQVGSADYKVRVGDYRLLALLAHEDRTIFIEKVDHRKRVYGR